MLLTFIEAAKTFVVESTGLSRDALHVHIGALVYVTLLATGQRRWTAFALIAVVEAVNECLDRLTHGSWRWADTRADIFNSLFIPLLMVIVGTYGRPARRETTSPQRGGASTSLPVDGNASRR